MSRTTYHQCTSNTKIYEPKQIRTSTRYKSSISFTFFVRTSLPFIHPIFLSAITSASFPWRDTCIFRSVPIHSDRPRSLRRQDRRASCSWGRPKLRSVSPETRIVVILLRAKDGLSFLAGVARTSTSHRPCSETWRSSSSWSSDGSSDSGGAFSPLMVVVVMMPNEVFTVAAGYCISIICSSSDRPRYHSPLTFSRPSNESSGSSPSSRITISKSSITGAPLYVPLYLCPP
jgi:hypothetical protein